MSKQCHLCPARRHSNPLVISLDSTMRSVPRRCNIRRFIVKDAQRWAVVATPQLGSSGRSNPSRGAYTLAHQDVIGAGTPPPPPPPAPPPSRQPDEPSKPSVRCRSSPREGLPQ